LFFKDNSRFQWDTQSTKLLIEEVRNNMALLNQKNCLQKNIWKRIANKFIEKNYNITEEQCNTKWKNLKRKYKSVRDLNNQTGKNRESWEYFDVIDDFINTRPEIAPASIASSTHGFRIKESSLLTEQNEESTNENDSAAINANCYVRHNIRKRRKSDKPQWVKILYEQREIHHQRNIKMQKRFLKLFKKYLQKDNTVKQ